MQFGTRRRFLLVSAGWGAALGLGAAGVVCSRSKRAETGLTRVSRTSHALGTQVAITALHESPGVAELAIKAAFAELETVEQVMSIYRPGSELSRLNRAGRLDSPHPYLVEVLWHAASVSRASQGAFDVTVQPLWELYAAAHKSGSLPADEQIATARLAIDWRRVEVSTQRIRLRGDGIRVTLNGIAQGFAADRAMAALRICGIEQALVDTGELSPLGWKERSAPWTAGIQHPREADAYLAVVPLEGRCLATSGDYATTFSPDRKYNHLFDPRTGRSPDELASVSILAPTAMQADALSTAVFVLGPERGLELISQLDGVNVLLALKSGRTLATAGFPQEGQA